MTREGFAYLMASRLNGTIYTGSTSNLVARAYQHRNALIDGFTKEHGCHRLVWYEHHPDIRGARERELRIKKWKRGWKIDLINSRNPEWCDLFEEICG